MYNWDIVECVIGIIVDVLGYYWDYSGVCDWDIVDVLMLLMI